MDNRQSIDGLSAISSLDQQFEDLITERNNFEKDNIKLKKENESLRRTIEVMNEQARIKRVPKKH